MHGKNSILAQRPQMRQLCPISAYSQLLHPVRCVRPHKRYLLGATFPRSLKRAINSSRAHYSLARTRSVALHARCLKRACAFAAVRSIPLCQTHFIVCDASRRRLRKCPAYTAPNSSRAIRLNAQRLSIFCGTCGMIHIKRSLRFLPRR